MDMQRRRPAMSRRILFLEALPIISGGQRVLLHLIPALREYDLHALLPGPGPLSLELARLGVACHFARMADYTLVHKHRTDILRFPADQVRLAYACRRLIQTQRIELVYANSSRTFAWGALAAGLSRRPIVWHLHNVIGDSNTRILLAWAGRIPAVRRIIAASQAAADELSTLDHKTVVIPGGVDTQLFRPNRAAGMQVRRELGLGEHDSVIGIAGDLIPLKGQHTVLEACRLLPDPPTCLVVGSPRAGDAESIAYAQRLRAMSSDKALFTGMRTDMPAVLNALDLLVVASTQETGPLVLLEALACGLPVVSTPVGRARELLPPEFLFAIGDADALASRLHTVLRDRAAAEGYRHRARRLAEDKLTVQQFQSSVLAQISAYFSPEHEG